MKKNCLNKFVFLEGVLSVDFSGMKESFVCMLPGNLFQSLAVAVASLLSMTINPLRDKYFDKEYNVIYTS